MFAKFKILPIVILAAMLLLGVKVVELSRGTADFGIATAFAKGDKDKAKAADEAKSKTPGPADDAVAEDEKGAVSKSKHGKTGGKDGKKVASRKKIKKKTSFTEAEVEVLQRLSGRREALQQRSRQMAMREKILQATEQRIDKKIVDLKKLEIRIKSLLLEHDKEAEQQIKSLVKVYESMKPKDAARIFEQLEMEILLVLGK